MPTKREHRVTSGDLLLYAVAEGNPEATPIVLVHGYPDNHSVWDKVATALSREYLVIRYDVRGAGRPDNEALSSKLPAQAAAPKAPAHPLPRSGHHSHAGRLRRPPPDRTPGALDRKADTAGTGRPHWAPLTEPDAICQSVGSFVTANR